MRQPGQPEHRERGRARRDGRCSNPRERRRLEIAPCSPERGEPVASESALEQLALAPRESGHGGAAPGVALAAPCKPQAAGGEEELDPLLAGAAVEIGPVLIDRIERNERASGGLGDLEEQRI